MLLKRTLSVCPYCNIRIPAEIIEENNSAYMLKTCPEHGQFKALVERDVKFYKDIDSNRLDSIPHTAVIPITNNCHNNHCTFKQHCYNYSNQKQEHLSLEKYIEHLKYLKKHHPSVCYVVISGGEPLENPGYLEFLQETHKNGFFPVIATNATHLISYDTFKKLKGMYFVLNYVSNFPALKTFLDYFTYFDDKEKICLQACITKDNPKFLEEFLNFSFKNKIKSLRLRTLSKLQSRLGKEEQTEFFISDILKLLAKYFGKDEGYFLKLDKISTNCQIIFRFEIVVDKDTHELLWWEGSNEPFKDGEKLEINVICWPNALNWDINVSCSPVLHLHLNNDTFVWMDHLFIEKK